MPKGYITIEDAATRLGVDRAAMSTLVRCGWVHTALDDDAVSSVDELSIRYLADAVTSARASWPATDWGALPTLADELRIDAVKTFAVAKPAMDVTVARFTPTELGQDGRPIAGPLHGHLRNGLPRTRPF